MRTLLLDVKAWDLTLDVANNIAVASDPYSIAQDAASAIKLFQGELWYNTVPGVPYWDTILGFAPPLSYLKAQFVKAALRVPQVVSAKCFITRFEGRVVEGQVQIISTDGQTAAASF